MILETGRLSCEGMSQQAQEMICLEISCPTTMVRVRLIVCYLERLMERIGGMDAYVREFGSSKDHDHFYSDNDIINIFENYTTQVIQRYVNSPAIFAWELANDPRCNSSLPSTTNCQTTTITQWHDTVSQHVNTVDPNHLVSSG